MINEFMSVNCLKELSLICPNKANNLTRFGEVKNGRRWEIYRVFVGNDVLCGL